MDLELAACFLSVSFRKAILHVLIGVLAAFTRARWVGGPAPSGNQMLPGLFDAGASTRPHIPWTEVLSDDTSIDYHGLKVASGSEDCFFRHHGASGSSSMAKDGGACALHGQQRRDRSEKTVACYVFFSAEVVLMVAM